MAEPRPAGPAKVSHPLRVRTLTVERVEDVTPRLRRVVLTGRELEGFAADGPSDHAKVFFPGPDGRIVLPTLDESGAWVNRGDPGLTYREYTVRTFEPGSGELAFEMYLHPHGPAGRWAAGAAPGQVLAVLGPKTSNVPPLNLDWYLLAADSAGLPAVRNWLDRLPAGVPVLAFVLVDSAADRLGVPERPGLAVRWVARGDAPAGATAHLRDAVASCAFPPGVGWCWAGAEAGEVRALRHHLRERGVPPSSTNLTGYWRAGVAHFDHKSPEAEA